MSDEPKLVRCVLAKSGECKATGDKYPWCYHHAPHRLTYSCRPQKAEKCMFPNREIWCE